MVEARHAVVRPAARILLCDPSGRVLLFDSQINGRRVWITPGGGLSEGETHEAAAARELWEETGIQADRESLVCVWVRSHVFEFRGGLIDQQERYFFLRCDDGPGITYANWEIEEHDQLLAHRWWSVEEIEASEELFAPRRLGALLRQLLRDGAPETPFDVGI